MLLDANPFYLLGASPRDNRQRLSELAEDRALVASPDVSARAFADLINPRLRLPAEIAWLPGMAPNRALAMVDEVVQRGTVVPTPSALARLNLGVTAFATHPPVERAASAFALAVIAQDWDEVDAHETLVLLNEERAVAGMPMVASIRDVELALESRFNAVQGVLVGALRRMGESQLVSVLSEFVDVVTSSNEESAPPLAYAIVDALEVDVQSLLEREREVVTSALEATLRAGQEGSPRGIDLALTRLEEAVSLWDSHAQCLQVAAQTRGQQHQLSLDLAQSIRAAAVDLHNEHGLTAAAERITMLLARAFAELPQFAERVEEDVSQLADLREAREADQRRAAEHAKAIEYSASWGLVFKSKLRLSIAGVEFGRKSIALEDIRAVTWGGTSHSVSGIPTGTSYNVALYSQSDQVSIDLTDRAIYTELTARLWRAVGVRLVLEMLDALRGGERLRFPDAVVLDTGVVLGRARLLRKPEAVNFSWNDVLISTVDGAMVLAGRSTPGFQATMPYLSTRNAHILEFAIRSAFKKGARRLSEILQS